MAFVLCNFMFLVIKLHRVDTITIFMPFLDLLVCKEARKFGDGLRLVPICGI